jgi:hypothetical protein
MPAPETIQINETPRSARSACLNTGCPCKDSRIVSHRRAGFFAAVARFRGETADRVVPAEPGWRLPGTSTAA